MRNLTLNIDFPALDRLVNYLEQQDSTQAKVDQLAALLGEQSEQLQQSATDLDYAVATNRS